VPFIITEIDHDAVTGKTVITWNSRANRNYAVDSSDDLSTWVELNDSIASEGEATSFADNFLPIGTSHKYYRVREIQ
jgi:hypothetical protein